MCSFIIVASDAIQWIFASFTEGLRPWPVINRSLHHDNVSKKQKISQIGLKFTRTLCSDIQLHGPGFSELNHILLYVY